MEMVQVPPFRRAGEVAEGTLVTTDFVDCYQTHYGRLVRALCLSGADPAAAQDLAQEAFARAFARWRRVSKGSNPPGYVYTTGFRLWHRTQRRAVQAADDMAAHSTGPQATGRPPAPTESAALTKVAVEATLAGMPPRRRACAVMCLLVGLSVRETASTLKIADGTVRKHLEEARRDLRATCGPAT